MTSLILLGVSTLRPDEPTDRPTTALSSWNRFFSRNCTQYIVLFRELSPHNSSFLGTISSQQFFFGNHILPTVLFRELFPRNSSFSGTVSTKQFFFGNCFHRTVLLRELWHNKQFLVKNCCSSAHIDDHGAILHRSVPIEELFGTDQFRSKNCLTQISSDQRTVQTDQFRSKNCSDSSVPIKELFR